MHIGTLTNTDLPLTPPPLPTVCLGILESYRVFGSSQEKRESGRRESGGREERLLHLSQVRLGARGSPKPFSTAETENGGRGGNGEKGGKKPSMTKRDAADTPATRHQTIKTNKAPLSADVCRNYRFGGQISSQEVLSLTLPP